MWIRCRAAPRTRAGRHRRWKSCRHAHPNLGRSAREHRARPITDLRLPRGASRRRRGSAEKSLRALKAHRMATLTGVPTSRHCRRPAGFDSPGGRRLRPRKRCALGGLRARPRTPCTRSPPRLVCFRRRSTPGRRRHPPHRPRRRCRARRRPLRRRRARRRPRRRARRQPQPRPPRPQPLPTPQPQPPHRPQQQQQHVRRRGGIYNWGVRVVLTG